VAKIDVPAGDVTRGSVIKFKGKAQIKGWKGVVYAAAWPRPNSETTKEKKRPWTDYFSCVNRALKSPPPKVLDNATSLTKGTGWYYRDVLFRGAVNKLILMDGAQRVNVPTVAVARLANQSLPSTVDTNIVMDTEVWDNREMWSPDEPSIIRFTQAGLYLVQASYSWSNSSTTGSLYAEIAHSRWGKITADQRSVNANVTMQGSLGTIIPCYENDSVTIWMRSNAGNRNAQVLMFSAIGITPELVS